MNDEVELKISEIVGEYCADEEKGWIVFRLILAHLKKNKKVSIDFENVKVVLSCFLNMSIGRLLEHYKKDELKNLLTFKNIDDVNADLLKLVIDNAVKYYENENYRTSIREALSKFEDDRVIE